MKKRNRIWSGYLAWIPAAAILVMIFVLSSQNGSDSIEASSSVAMKIADKTRLEVDFNDIGKLQNFDAFNLLIRNLAHMIEYALFALATGFAVTVNGFRGKMRFIYTCLLGFSVSFLDEFYQIFVPGRYGDIVDFLLDSSSIFLLALCMFLPGKLCHKKSGRKETLPEAREVPSGKKQTGKQKNELRRPFMASYIDSISLADVLEMFRAWMKQERSFHYIVTPNADHMVMLEKDGMFREIYEHADLILTDGQPLMWIAESLGNPIAEKIPGSDLLPHVCRLAEETGSSLFILGTTEENAGKAAGRMQKEYPGLRVAGTYSPAMGFEKNKEQQELAVAKINSSKADILVLALGSPKQEKFLYTNRDRLAVRLALPIGAAVDFMAGAVNRAPEWMRAAGLEWLYRFLQEPGRLFRRYFIEDMKIFLLAWKYRLQISEKS